MNKMPKKKSHTVRRLLSYVGRGYLIRFFLVLVCILVSAVASVASSLFLKDLIDVCLLYTSPSPRDTERSRMPSSA